MTISMKKQKSLLLGATLCGIGLIAFFRQASTSAIIPSRHDIVSSSSTAQEDSSSIAVVPSLTTSSSASLLAVHQRRKLASTVGEHPGTAPSAPKTEQHWFNDFNVVHVVNTRFMEHQAHLFHLAKARLDLFKTFTLPSMKLQSSQQFLWLIWTDPNLEERIRQELLDLVSPMIPNVIVIASAENVPRGQNLRSMYGHSSWQALTEGVLSGNANLLSDYYFASLDRVLMETRLDADDALSISFVESAQAQAAAAVGRGDFTVPGQVQHFCPQSHVEWRYFHPDHHEIRPLRPQQPRSNNAVTASSGYLLHISNPEFCIASGATSVYHLETFGTSPLMAQQEVQHSDSTDVSHRGLAPLGLLVPVGPLLLAKIVAVCLELVNQNFFDDDQAITANTSCGPAFKTDDQGNVQVLGDGIIIYFNQCHCECGQQRRLQQQQPQLHQLPRALDVSGGGCACGPPLPPPTCQLVQRRRCRRERALEELFEHGHDNNVHNEEVEAGEETNSQHCHRRLRLLPKKHENKDAGESAYHILPALVLMARTPAAAGMKNVMPNRKGGGVNSIRLDTFDDHGPSGGDDNDENKSGEVSAAAQDEAWVEMERSFGVQKAQVATLYERFEADIEHILVDAFAGQCTPGHSCKDSTKKALGSLLNQVHHREQQ